MVEKVKNLSELRRTIGFSVYISFFVLLLFSLVAIYLIDLRAERIQAKLSMQQVRATNHVFQASLSEQLGIMASSSIFLDFLRSGEETRKSLLPDFLYALSQINMDFHWVN